MTDNTKYRFLPWARRGIAGAIEVVDAGEALPQRANVSMGITITNMGIAGSEFSLYGPGDVLGIDTQLIVRTSPVANATNTEPNYFAGIEFDPPDFPWLFTPASEGENHRLRPWIALVVLDRAVVDLPSMRSNQPLPSISIPGDVVGQELPDLSESWAWAHTQVMTGTGPANLPNKLKNEPDLNVSRLLCPRHLEANKQYIACLVPAFDVGVLRGLGIAPATDMPAGPAWSLQQAADLVLPVYFHWTFATGPLGDFESLARKLKPFASPETVGVIPMYIGDASPHMPLLPSKLGDGSPNEDAIVEMDGVLRAPNRDSGVLEDILPEYRDGLKDILNAPLKQLEDGPSDATPVLGPPIYGQWQAKQHTITDEEEEWLNELNLDPRSRTAAGLGAEVVRRNQEEFMQASWEQVADVLAANNRMGWARLSLEVNRCTYKRHYQLLPNDRFMQLTAPLHRRTLEAQVTIKRTIDGSSMPVAMIDTAFRRLVSPQRPVLKTSVRRLTRENRLSPVFASRSQSSLLNNTAAGTFLVDPTRFKPDGLVQSFVLGNLTNGEITTVAGTPVDIDSIIALKGQTDQLASVDYQATPLQIGPRANLKSNGLITTAQIDALRTLEASRDKKIGTSLNMYSALNSYLTVAGDHKGAKGVFFSIDSGGLTSVNPIFVSGLGQVLVGTGKTNQTSIGSISMSSFGEAFNFTQLMFALPPGTFTRTADLQPIVTLNAQGSLEIKNSILGDQPTFLYNDLFNRRIGFGGQLLKNRVILPPIGGGGLPLPGPFFTPVNKTLPMPLFELEEVQHFQSLVQSSLLDHGSNDSAVFGELKSLAVNAISSNLVERISPDVMVPRRLRHLINLSVGDLWSTPSNLPIKGLHLTPAQDRVLAYPEIPSAMYSFLAEYSQEQFCPGIGIIPPNSITLLETNPRFIEAFMVGLNYEMNRELMWREYPSDQRGTTFQYFWDWLDDQPDIDPIHTWEKNSELGTNTRGSGVGGQIVLLVKGELVNRYPNLVMMAWKATLIGSELKLIDPPDDQDIRLPVFQGKLQPDVTFAGFDLPDTELLEGDGWFFIVQEQPTEPRFGLDEGESGEPDVISDWDNASWVHAGVVPGKHLKLANAGVFTDITLDSFTFGKNSAHMASITLQRPMRVAVHASTVLE